MKIEKILTRSRRDFTAVMKCEFCEYQVVNRDGYDDRNYHDNVIPAMTCENCGRSTKSEGGEIDHTPTKYPDNAIV